MNGTSRYGQPSPVSRRRTLKPDVAPVVTPGQVIAPT
jgi:hypothetical protein